MNSLDKNYAGSTMQYVVFESYRGNKFCQGLDIKIPFSWYLPVKDKQS